MPNIPEPTIIRSRRSSITIQITRGGEFIVKAPILMPSFLIRKFVEQKKDWIIKTLTKVQAHVPVKKEYREGEAYMYLGTPLTLRLHNGTKIAIQDKELLFPKALQFRLQKELKNWYIAQAKKIIEKRLEVKALEMDAHFKSI